MSLQQCMRHVSKFREFNGGAIGHPILRICMCWSEECIELLQSKGGQFTFHELKVCAYGFLVGFF